MKLIKLCKHSNDISQHYYIQDKELFIVFFCLKISSYALQSNADKRNRQKTLTFRP
jgi:hypothetical protein